MVSRLLGRMTTSPAPVPHHRFFSRSSHKEITQSDGKPLVRFKMQRGRVGGIGKHQPQAVARGAADQHAGGGFQKVRNNVPSPRRSPQVGDPLAVFPFADAAIAGHPNPAVAAPRNALDIRIGFGVGVRQANRQQLVLLERDTRPSRSTKICPLAGRGQGDHIGDNPRGRGQYLAVPHPRQFAGFIHYPDLSRFVRRNAVDFSAAPVCAQRHGGETAILESRDIATFGANPQNAILRFKQARSRGCCAVPAYCRYLNTVNRTPSNRASPL